MEPGENVTSRRLRQAIQLAGLGVLLVTAPAPARGADTNEFVARVYTNSLGRTLPYRLLLPEVYTPTRAYPVILYLHGAAGRGNDNLKPLEWGPRLFLEGGLRQKHGFFLVVPQCSLSSGWQVAEFDDQRSMRESESLQMALELVETILPGQFNVDARRRYLTGVSMGGHAVWAILVRRPGLFAAAVPVCAGGSAKMVTDAAARYPVWAFHSDDDHLVPVQQARDLVKAWREHGGTARYTEYTGLKHSSWKKAYLDPEMFDWLFQQHLP